MRNRVTLSCIAVALICTACPEIPTLDYIDMDKNNISYPASGGCDTISMLSDYEDWWIYCVKIERLKYEFDENTNRKRTYITDEKRYYYEPKKHSVAMNVAGYYEMFDNMQFDCDELSLLIPAEEPNRIVIKCNENEEMYDRRITVLLEIDDRRDCIGELMVKQDGCRE